MGRIIKKYSGITLSELLISTALIGLVLLTAASLDIAARRFFSDAEEGIAALNDMSVAMEYMVKGLESSIGDFSTSGRAFTNYSIDGTCAAYSNGFRVRLDDDEDGQVSAGDVTVEFCYDAGNNEILRIEGASTDTIANRITGFTYDTYPALPPVSEVVIKLSAQDDPGSGQQLDLQSRAYLRAAPTQE